MEEVRVFDPPLSSLSSLSISLRRPDGALMDNTRDDFHMVKVYKHPTQQQIGSSRWTAYGRMHSRRATYLKYKVSIRDFVNWTTFDPKSHIVISQVPDRQCLQNGGSP
jgi:hypothetical protein